MEGSASTSTKFMRLENFVEPLRRRPLESDMQTVERLLMSRARAGWELVDVCDDEFHVCNLIFKRMVNIRTSLTYVLGEIPIDKNLGDVQSILNFLTVCLRNDYVPVCIIENTGKKPIAILKKATHSCEESRVKAFPVSLKAFGRRQNVVKDTLFELQSKHGMSLACIIHGGLNPVLIGISHEHDQPYDYLVDSAFGGFYQNQATTLADLIQLRSEEGWHICASFIDAMRWPCVIFKRETLTEPDLPLRSA